MGKMAGPECCERLREMVKDEHPQVRSIALKSLIEIRRAESKSPAAIAARAGKADSKAAAKVFEKAEEAIRMKKSLRVLCWASMNRPFGYTSMELHTRYTRSIHSASSRKSHPALVDR